MPARRAGTARAGVARRGHPPPNCDAPGQARPPVVNNTAWVSGLAFDPRRAVSRWPRLPRSRAHCATGFGRDPLRRRTGDLLANTRSGAVAFICRHHAWCICPSPTLFSVAGPVFPLRSSAEFFGSRAAASAETGALFRAEFRPDPHICSGRRFRAMQAPDVAPTVDQRGNAATRQRDRVSRAGGTARAKTPPGFRVASAPAPQSACVTVCSASVRDRCANG